MPINQIIQWIAMIAPNFITAISTVIVITQCFKSIIKLKEEFSDLKEIDELKLKISELLKDNSELKKEVLNLLTKIDHISRKEPLNVNTLNENNKEQ